MSVKKNTQPDYTPNTHKKWTFEIDLFKAVAIVATAILTSGVAGVFATVRILSSDHFLLNTVSTRVLALEAEKLDKSEFLQFEKRLESIETKLDTLLSKAIE